MSIIGESEWVDKSIVVDDYGHEGEDWQGYDDAGKGLAVDDNCAKDGLRRKELSREKSEEVGC